MLTKRGHGFAAYVLLLLSLCHWIDGRRLDREQEPAAAAAEKAPEEE